VSGNMQVLAVVIRLWLNPGRRLTEPSLVTVPFRAITSSRDFRNDRSGPIEEMGSVRAEFRRYLVYSA
jgi:hypothetical protein